MKTILSSILLLVTVAAVALAIGTPTSLTAAASEAAALREQAYAVTDGRSAAEKHQALVNLGVIAQYTELQDAGNTLLAADSESAEAKTFLREIGYLGNFIAATEQTAS